MDSDQNKPISGLQDHLNKSMAAIRAVTEKLAPTFAEAANNFKKFGALHTEKKDQSKHAGSNNHGQKRNKTRYLMAKKSNQINRKRVKHWKN